jgi:hypothetical protein
LTDSVDTFSAFSSRGPRRDGVLKPELGAPGQALIVPFVPGADIFSMYAVGTSFSSPHMAGTVALLLVNNENLNPDDILSSINGQTTRPWEIDDQTWNQIDRGYRGAGKLDAYELVKALINLPEPPTGLSARVVNGSFVRLDWLSSPSPDVTSYNIYYDGGTGTMDYQNAVGTVPATTLSWVTPWPLRVGIFSFGVRTVNAEGKEDRNNQVVSQPVLPQLFGGAGDDDFCFIATAAFQDSRAPQVERLREIRDRFVLRFSWGRRFVRDYYRLSPPVAAWLKEHRFVSGMVKTALMPLVGCAQLAYHGPAVGWIAGGLCMGSLLTGLVGFRRKRT